MAPASPQPPRTPDPVSSEKRVGHYRILRRVGKGGFGEALLVEDINAAKKGESKKLIAKRIGIGSMTNKERESAMMEVKVLSELSVHPYVVKYHEAFIHQNYLFVIMDYCEKGDLQVQINNRRAERAPLTEDQILRYFAQIAAAVHHMHSRKMLHRDLKLANILIESSSRIRVTDFGISKCFPDQTKQLATTLIGTPTCMSPEIFKKIPYGYPADIWSLGCILFEMITLDMPFNGSSIMGISRAIQNDPVPPLPSHISKPLRDLCNMMLSKDPAKRPTSQQVLTHPAVQGAIAKLVSRLK